MMNVEARSEIQSHGKTIVAEANVLQAVYWTIICGTKKEPAIVELPIKFNQPVGCYEVTAYLLLKRGEKQFKAYTQFSCQPTKGKG